MTRAKMGQRIIDWNTHTHTHTHIHTHVHPRIHTHKHGSRPSALAHYVCIAWVGFVAPILGLVSILMLQRLCVRHDRFYTKAGLKKLQDGHGQGCCEGNTHFGCVCVCVCLSSCAHACVHVHSAATLVKTSSVYVMSCMMSDGSVDRALSAIRHYTAHEQPKGRRCPPSDDGRTLPLCGLGDVILVKHFARPRVP